MNALKWAENMLKDAEAQRELELKIEILVNMYFKGKSDYAIEKFIKSFGEGFIYLESLMLKERDIHPSQFEENRVHLMSHPEETARKLQEVKNTLLNEINRQYRHFSTFLSDVTN